MVDQFWTKNCLQIFQKKKNILLNSTDFLFVLEKINIELFLMNEIFKNSNVK